MRRKKPARFLPLFSLIPLLLPTPLPAGFTIETGQVSHEKQSLSGEGDCGDVAKNALLDILNATAVTMNSEKQSLQNCGSIFGNWYELSPSEVLALINSYGRCNNITNNGTIRATSSFGLQLFNEAGESSIAIIDGQSQLLTAIRSQGCWVKINNRNSLTACANFAATLCSATNSGTTTLIASDIELTSAAILSRGEDAIAVNRGSVLSRSSATTLLSAFALDEGGSAQLTAEKIHATAYGVLSEGVRAKIWEKKSTVVEAVNSLTLSQQEPDARPLPQLSDIKAAGYGIGAKIGPGFCCPNGLGTDPTGAALGHKADELVVDFHDLGLQVSTNSV